MGIHKKARKQAMRKIKPQKIKWTTSWRRLNKKIKNTELAKKKRRKAKTADDRGARKNEAIRQIKERRAKVAKANVKVAAPKQHAKPANAGKGKGAAGKR